VKICLLVFAAEDLGHKRASFGKKVCRQPQGLKNKLRLSESVLDPSTALSSAHEFHFDGSFFVRSNIGRAVVQDTVCLQMFDVTPDSRAALVGRDVALERNDSWDWLDRSEIHGDDEGVRRHDLSSDLTPRAWRSTEIDYDLGPLQEVVFAIELDQLERRTGAVALFFGELVPFVETAFAVLLLDRHRVVSFGGGRLAQWLGWCAGEKSRNFTLGPSLPGGGGRQKQRVG
jgi:hypothetical protein